MKSAPLIFILFISFQSFAQAKDDSLAGKLGKHKDQSNTSVMDLADTAISFYDQKDPMFIMSTYISLSCAEKDGQLEDLAEELLRLPAKHQLIRLVESIKVQNEHHQKTPVQVVNEYYDNKNKSIQKFFQMSLLKIARSEETVECYLSRVR